MVTAMGEDAHAQQIQHSCRELGIDLSHSLTVPNARTSTYLCLNDANGEIVGAMSDMAIYDALTPAYLSTQLEAGSTGRRWWCWMPICRPKACPFWLKT